MAGIALTPQRRSQLLEALLQQQMQQPNIQSGGELGVRLLAQALRQKQVNQLQGQEAQSQQQIADALGAGQATAPKSITLEDIEGGSGRQQVAIPGRREVKSEQADALSRLNPTQQAQAQEILANRKALSEPGLAEQIKMREESNARLQRQNNSAALERQQLQEDAAAARQERQIEAQMSSEQRGYIQRDTEQIREIQSRVALTRLESDLEREKIKDAAKNQGIDLTEQQAKATGWYTSAAAGSPRSRR